jgi:hypothetical protein
MVFNVEDFIGAPFEVRSRFYWDGVIYPDLKENEGRRFVVWQL